MKENDKNIFISAHLKLMFPFHTPLETSENLCDFLMFSGKTKIKHWSEMANRDIFPGGNNTYTRFLGLMLVKRKKKEAVIIILTLKSDSHLPKKLFYLLQ